MWLCACHRMAWQNFANIFASLTFPVPIFCVSSVFDQHKYSIESTKDFLFLLDVVHVVIVACRINLTEQWRPQVAHALRQPTIDRDRDNTIRYLDSFGICWTTGQSTVSTVGCSVWFMRDAYLHKLIYRMQMYAAASAQRCYMPCILNSALPHPSVHCSLCGHSVHLFTSAPHPFIAGKNVFFFCSRLSFLVLVRKCELSNMRLLFSSQHLSFDFFCWFIDGREVLNVDPSCVMSHLTEMNERLPD